jgi:hypothetical protein
MNKEDGMIAKNSCSNWILKSKLGWFSSSRFCPSEKKGILYEDPSQNVRVTLSELISRRDSAIVAKCNQ